MEIKVDVFFLLGSKGLKEECNTIFTSRSVVAPRILRRKRSGSRVSTSSSSSPGHSSAARRLTTQSPERTEGRRVENFTE